MVSTKSYDATISLKAIDKLLAIKTDLDVVDYKVMKRIFQLELSPLFQRNDYYYLYPVSLTQKMDIFLSDDLGLALDHSRFSINL